MSVNLPGIHHVTAICGDPQRNLDFYTGTLGLRLVKQTVNFDDPGRYHLYYGDAAGTPGTVERVNEPQEPVPSPEVREYVRLKSLLDDFGHQMPPGSRGHLEEQVAALEPEWTAHQERKPGVTVRVRLDNGFVLDAAAEELFTPA